MFPLLLPTERIKGCNHLQNTSNMTIRERRKANMPAINWWAIAVAALIAFVASSVWYIVLGKELATVSPAFAEGLQKRQPWKMLFVIAEHRSEEHTSELQSPV